jgi:hypothetical protein
MIDSVPSPDEMLLWGAVATAVMTGVLQGAQGAGLSRLSIAFLVGTVFTEDRRKATLLGFSLYALGGWMFALLYFLLLDSLHLLNWWAGALVGLLHGLLLLVAVLPLLPLVHPRMASDYDSHISRPVLEPPGFLALHYGRGTPLSLLVAQILYGMLIGGLPQISRAGL